MRTKLSGLDLVTVARKLDSELDITDTRGSVMTAYKQSGDGRMITFRSRGPVFWDNARPSIFHLDEVSKVISYEEEGEKTTLLQWPEGDIVLAKGQGAVIDPTDGSLVFEPAAEDSHSTDGPRLRGKRLKGFYQDCIKSAKTRGDNGWWEIRVATRV
jgi:hypothetical protein